MATFTHYRWRIFDRLKHLTGHLVHTEVVNILALLTRNCETLIFSSKASINTIRKSKFAISVCNFSFLFQLSSHTPIQPRLCSTKNFSRSRCSHLDVQIFDRTGQKFDPNLSGYVFKRRGVQIFVRLARFHVNGTPNVRIFDRSEIRPVPC